jgi:putative FmdB family regulatory protein
VPIYEFNCARCGKLSEVVQHVGQRPPPCPHCGSKRMKRAVSRTSFRLKGGGWYADLYSTPRPGADKAGGAEKSANADKAGGADKAPPGGEKSAAPAKAEGAAKPATPSAGEPATPREGAPRAATGPARARPSSPRKRR